MRIRDFWERVVEEATPRVVGMSPCWTYTGADRNGYGRFSSVFAHRYAATLYIGERPSKVTHRCDNRRCVRREHLIISKMVDRKVRKSSLTGKPLPLPVWLEPNLIAEVMKQRKLVKKMNTDRIAHLCSCSVLTVKKIFMEAPIYDAIEEMKEGEYRTTPNLKEGGTLPKDVEAKFLTIRSNQNVQSA